MKEGVRIGINTLWLGGITRGRASVYSEKELATQLKQDTRVMSIRETMRSLDI